MTLHSSSNTSLAGRLVRIGRKQNGESFFTDSLESFGFVGPLERGHIVFVLGPNADFDILERKGLVSYNVVRCLSPHGIVWCTLDGFRAD